MVNKKKEELVKKNNEIKAVFEKISRTINNKVFTFFQECKENGDLYGSIKPKQIIKFIKKSLMLK